MLASRPVPDTYNDGDVNEQDMVSILADRDRDRFLELLRYPPEATEALKRAARRYRELIVRSEEATTHPSPGSS